MTAPAGDTLPLPRDRQPEAADRHTPPAAAPELALAAQKLELRTRLRRLRSAIPKTRRLHCQRRAALHLLRWRRLRQARHIAVYLSVRSELSTAALIERLLRRRHRLWAPVTTPGQRMRFAPLQRGGKLRRDALGLPRPARARPLKSLRGMDLVVLPLLGFDSRGHRLGAGGGYYDRALAGTGPTRRPWLVGYAYAAQEVAAVPAEPWDVKLDAAVTERGLRRFR